MTKNRGWNLTDLKDVPQNGLKVFSAFHCGGGSTMGYKLAGYQVIGGIEIDPQMMAVYRANHSPRYSYLMGVEDFHTKFTRDLLPEDLVKLDILDGSPPCSSFSMAGVRDKKWGEKKKFREGQAEQVLDDLFFHFLDVADLLKPKVIVAENVKGLIQGKARGYVKQIAEDFDKIGYDLQLFLLNAAFMGVPQTRERTFFIGRRKDLNLPDINLQFNEPIVSVETAVKDLPPQTAVPLTKMALSLWNQTPQGKGFGEAHPRGSWYAHRKPHPKRPSGTVIAQTPSYHWSEPRYLSKLEISRIQTFPDDFNFLDQDPQYLCGMSVPPFMMHRIATEIEKQWFKT